MRAFVLAAGTGNRLQPYTSLIPKPLLPVGGKPCIRYIVERLSRQGFRDIVICVNESHLPMFQYDMRDLDVSFSVSKQPMGTAGELLNCRELIDGDFLIHYADELTKVDFKKLTELHNSKNDGLGTLALLNRFPLPVGLIKLEGGEVREFREKPSIEAFFWVGIAVLREDILKYLRHGDDFARDVFPKVLNEGKKIHAHVFENEWIDIGNISRYKHANELAKKGLIS